MKKIIFLSAIIFCISCNKETVKNEQWNKVENRCTIELKAKVDIPIDDETSALIPYMQYFDENTVTDMLLTLNTHNNSIYFFDYARKEFIKKIMYEKEGNNGVGEIQGFNYLNPDSIFVYNYWGMTIYLTNDRSVVNWKRRLPMDGFNRAEFMPAYPWLQTNSPMIYLDKELVFGGFMGAETTAQTITNSPVTTIYDFQKDTIFFANNYPEQYIKYNWGGGFFKMPYFDVNKDKKNVIVSFPQDHNIYVYSLDSREQHKFYAGSSMIPEIKAFDPKKELRTQLDDNRTKRWFFSTPSYRNIIYDKYRDLYYRLFCLPLKEGNDKWQPLGLIVLDGNFNYVGEGLLPEDVNLRYSNSFVSKEGLNIQVMTDNDDLMTFYQFKVDIHE